MMTHEELVALEMVIDYLAEEADNYEDYVASGGDPTLHIYTHIKILDDYVKGMYSTGNFGGNNVRKT